MNPAQINQMEEKLRGLILQTGPDQGMNTFPSLPGSNEARMNTKASYNQHGSRKTYGETRQIQQQQSSTQAHSTLLPGQGQLPRQQGQSQPRQAQKFRKFEEWRNEVQVPNNHQAPPPQFRVAQRQHRQPLAQNSPNRPQQAVVDNVHGTSQYQPRGNYRSQPSQYTQMSRPNSQAQNQIFATQCQYLEVQLQRVMPELEMSPDEFRSKDSFRMHLEQTIQQALPSLALPEMPNVTLASFGSLASGFGMPGSDMDMVLLSSVKFVDLPRIIEKIILDMGHGARLLTRTRVPIIKICERPSTVLYLALREERQKWDEMTPEEREKYDHPEKFQEKPAEVVEEETAEAVKTGIQVDGPALATTGGQRALAGDRPHGPQPQTKSTTSATNGSSPHLQISSESGSLEAVADDNLPNVEPAQTEISSRPSGNQMQSTTPEKDKGRPRLKKPWLRERKLGPLDFPKDGVGIQCDINFSNNLGLHNTTLLRCYSHCDVRVRLMVLFVKAWAGRRKINSARDGTLSSYGYVLMVLHYLVNVAQPPVCPNLQLARRQQGGASSVICDGYDVQFWRNETEIQQLAAKKMLTHNQQPLGVLLRGFFQYYAQTGYDVPGGGFVWMQEVLSLRTPGGIMMKEQKGWTGAKSIMVHDVEVRNRYLFAIEDPFEHDHNVARTVTHGGIVAIRDEFRRAWRILMAIGRAGGEVETRDGEFMERVVEHHPGEDEQVKDTEPVDLPAEQTQPGQAFEAEAHST